MAHENSQRIELGFFPRSAHNRSDVVGASRRISDALRHRVQRFFGSLIEPDSMRDAHGFLLEAAQLPFTFGRVATRAPQTSDESMVTAKANRVAHRAGVRRRQGFEHALQRRKCGSVRSIQKLTSFRGNLRQMLLPWLSDGV